MLSNNHVLANSNDSAVGDAILQPGTADGGADPADRIAPLARFVEISFAADAENRVDGAIATPLAPAERQVVWSTRDTGEIGRGARRERGCLFRSVQVVAG